MRVIVCGSRDWAEPNVARWLVVDRLADLPGEGTVIVHGDARGIDRFAHQEAEKLGLLVEAHPYRPFISETCSPNRAPLERNRHMAKLGADLCIAFWNGTSTGTKHMIETAREHGIPVEEITIGTRPVVGGDGEVGTYIRRES